MIVFNLDFATNDLKMMKKEIESMKKRMKELERQNHELIGTFQMIGN